MNRHSIPFAIFVGALLISAPVRAGVCPVDPFEGALSENFDSFSQGARQKLRIMEGFGTVYNITMGGSLKVEYYSSLSGRVVQPHSRPLMLGQLGISLWEFSRPVNQFGSYFANNSRFDDAYGYFYDENGDLIDSLPVTVPNTGDWIWNGWDSDVPIKYIAFIGNDVEFDNGFIWFDDVQVN